MDASIKSLTITGTAVEDVKRSRQKSMQSRKRRGVIANDDPLDEPARPAQPVIPTQPLRPAQPVRPVQPVQPVRSAEPLRPVQPVRPAEPVKIISLEKATVPSPAQKVVLNPPKQIRVKLQPKPTPIITQPSVNSTRKARKIQLVVSNLNQRFTRAKKVKDETENTTIDFIREYLIQKGVIQQKSKAPEKMLRSMYSDFRILKGGHTL
jgi:hypothetical protein